MLCPPRYTLALDLGKKHHVASLFDTQLNQPLQTLKVLVNHAGFSDLEECLHRYSTNPTDFLVGCEATGHCGETILRRLQSQGYCVTRLNPTQVVQFRRGVGRKGKTDRLDAEAMALQLTVTPVVTETLRSDTERSLQRMTRLRLDFVEEQGRWVNRVHVLVNQIFPEVEPLLGNIATKTALAILSGYPSRRALANADLEELTRLVEKVSRKNKRREHAHQLQQAAQTSVGLDDPALTMELKIVLKQLLSVQESVNLLEHEIATLTTQLLAERTQAMRWEEPLTTAAFPIGTTLSIGTLLAEIGPIERFPTVKHLLSFFGWCPTTKESGASTSPHPKMSHQGNRFVRRTLWMLAIAGSQWVPEYRDYYQQRLAAGKNKMKSIVAIGRKILSAFWAILRTGKPYDPQRYLRNIPQTETAP